jgi:hypothetical protein
MIKMMAFENICIKNIHSIILRRRQVNGLGDFLLYITTAASTSYSGGGDFSNHIIV